MSAQNDLTKFLSIVDKNDVKVIKEEIDNNKVLNEGANPHKVSLPVQMAMQHYQGQAKKESLLKKYFNQISEDVQAQELQAETDRKDKIKQYAKSISNIVLEKRRY